MVAIPPEVEPYADDIRRFVDAMVYKLRVHHRKGRWDGKTVDEYQPLLAGEVKELDDAVASGNMVEILTEAADVANMAMIISAIAIERGK
jgi:NTP pyrophosphatase (non-canonical NTP hydrolase)